MAGKRYPNEFDRIDKVKANDKFLVADDSDGVVKYATPAQINAQFEGLVADIDTASTAAAAAMEAMESAVVAQGKAETAQDAAQTAQTAAETAQTAAETAQKAAEDSLSSLTSDLSTEVSERKSAVSALQEGVDANKAAAQAAQDDVDALKDDALIDVWDVVDERDLVLRTKEWHVNPDTMQWEALTDYTGQSVMVFRLRGAVRLRVSTLYNQCVLCKGFGTKGDAPLGDPLDGAAFTASQSILSYVDCEEYSYLVTGINGTSKFGERVYGSMNGGVTSLGIYLNIKETRLDYYYREAGRDNMEAAQYLARRMADGAGFHVNPLTEASDGGGVTASGICGTRARNVSYIEDNVQVCCNPRLETLQVRKLTGNPRFDTNFSLKDVRIIDMSGVTSLFGTFMCCPSLETVNASEWDTGKVTSMYCTFCFCGSLKSLDVSGWDVSNVTSLYSMFRFCQSLASLDVSGWNTSNVKNLSMTFQGCNSLKSLDVSGWNTSNVVNMTQMFYQSGIQSLDVSGWDTSNVTDMTYMFFDCGSLESLTFGTWDMGAVTSAPNMFASCNKLTTITGTMQNIKVDISLSSSPLTEASAMVVINGLYDFAAAGDTSTHTVSFSSTTKALLTDDDKAVATDKGWTIA